MIEPIPPQEEQDPPMEEAYFREILLLLLARKGTDFFYYKRPTIRRRIYRRMALVNTQTLTEYLDYLGKNDEEQDLLYLSLLIAVTSFFRDRAIFDNLCDTVFPYLLSAKQPGEPLRVWVAACSTGQEAYSIAICLKEIIADTPVKVQIFATDASAPAIRKARSGIYSKKEMAGVSQQRLERFFSEVNGQYRVINSIRDMCVFAEHNFIKDPPFGKLDFISCRNVLIYLETYLQKKALTNFHYALNPKGFLLLGKSESAEIAGDLFAVAGKSDKLFNRRDAPARYIHVPGNRAVPHPNAVANHITTTTMQNDFQKKADDIMLSQFMPAGVVINDTMDIVQFRGDCSRYLLQTSGTPTYNLLKLAKSGLSFELRAMLHKARSDMRAVVKMGIPVPVGESILKITVRVIPLNDLAEPHFLILFQEVPDEAPSGSGDVAADDKDLRIQQLEQELAQNREDMSFVLAEQEAANSELQSANEELLSSGEEMQSLNEELETSKEEMQSINEELTASNQELISLNEQITKAKNYAESIVATIHQPLLVLDKHLCVKTANYAFYRMFDLSSRGIEGKVMYQIDHQVWNTPEIRHLLSDTLPRQSSFTKQEIELRHPIIGSRTILFSGTNIPLEADEDQVILLVIEDITDQRKLRQAESDLLHKFQKVVAHAPIAMCILKGRDYLVDLANTSYLQLMDKQPDFVGRPLFVSMPELVPQGLKVLLDQVMDTGTSFYGHEHELYLQRHDRREQCFFNFVYQPMSGPTADTIGIIVVVTEVTEQVTARKKLAHQAQRVHELLKTAPGWICTLKGVDHVFDLVNDTFKQVFGKRAVSGMPILEAFPELEQQGMSTILDDVYQTGKSFTAYDMAISLFHTEAAGLEVGYFNFSYQPTYDDQGNIDGILAFGYEVTDQVKAKNDILQIQLGHSKALEAKVKQRTIELMSANELLHFKNISLRKLNSELESFAYVSSHDLQEPLRKIQTFSSMILADQSTQLSVNGRHYLQRMQDASKRMQTLIRDLLAYSRSNVTESDFEQTDLNPLVDAVIAEFSEAIQRTGATFHIGPLCDANIIPFQFSQILHNLISNSLKFARSGVPSVITIQSRTEPVSLLQQDDPPLSSTHLSTTEKCCHILFKDNGIGFEQAYNQKIFEIFQKLHSKNEYEGTGIGLAIVKKIVEHHRGVITAAGIVGEGATFNIYLPA